MLGLVDCNNFFVSCERTLDRSLEDRPVVVLSNNDGCVVARSNEAKRLGVKMGQPAFEIRGLLTSGQVIALSGNHLLYRAISMRIHDIFRRYAPRTIDYSVDEAFLDMSGIPDDVLPEIGAAIVKTCWEEEHIPVTVGFAPSKTLAKIATETGKKRGESVVALLDAEECLEIMRKLSIGELWGIGRRLSKRLYLEGVYTIADFAARELAWVRAKFGVNGERSWRELHGEDCIELSHLDRRMQDSISETRTFPVDIIDFDYIRSRIAIYCGHVAKRLRHMGGVCGEISVFLCSNRFHTERGYVAPSASARFNPPTSDTAVITGAGISLAEQIFDPAFGYKRAGVVISQITEARTLAPTLFEDLERQREATIKSRKLMDTIDRLNQGVGPSVLKLASELSKGHLGHNDGYSSSFGPAKEV